MPPGADRLVKATDAYRDETAARSQELIAAAEADYAAQRNLLIGACILAIVAAAVAGYFITRSLTRALGAEPADLGHIAHASPRAT